MSVNSSPTLSSTASVSSLSFEQELILGLLGNGNNLLNFSFLHSQRTSSGDSAVITANETAKKPAVGFDFGVKKGVKQGKKGVKTTKDKPLHQNSQPTDNQCTKSCNNSHNNGSGDMTDGDITADARCGYPDYSMDGTFRGWAKSGEPKFAVGEERSCDYCGEAYRITAYNKRFCSHHCKDLWHEGNGFKKELFLAHRKQEAS